MKKLNCLVTGASSGIGKEISIELSTYAKHIYICSRNVQKLEIVHDKIIENNCECTIVPLNLCDENVIENLRRLKLAYIHKGLCSRMRRMQRKGIRCNWAR